MLEVMGRILASYKHHSDVVIWIVNFEFGNDKEDRDCKEKGKNWSCSIER